MAYSTPPTKPNTGEEWVAWGDAADTNLRQLVTGVTPGTWTVGVTVVDPAGYLAPMRLANDNGSTAGVYPVGSITIT